MRDENDEPSEHVLRDGTRVRIRAVRPEDEATLQDGFRRLSPESRRGRFGREKTQLGRRELREIVACDGRRSAAFGAVRIDEDGWECEGLGLARYTSIPDHPEVAEPAVTVVDEAQGLGLGRLLSEHLIRAAAANGVKTFRALLQDEHEWLRERVRRSYPDARITRRGQLLGVEIPLPALGPAAEGPALDGSAASGPEVGAVRGVQDASKADVDPTRRFWSLLRWVAEGSVRPGQPGAVRALGGRLWRRVAHRPHRPPEDAAAPPSR